MMKYIRKAEDRGRVNLGWLKSNHSFSFGHYYDPKHMGLSALRVINDDLVMPGKGFGTHGHKDMEIISYVIEGALEHQDSTGNKFVVPAGEVQRMSAGSGIMHSEYNASSTDNVHFLQIWIQPKRNGVQPSYEQKKVVQKGPLTPIVTPNGAKGSLSINQDASLYRLVLNKNARFDLKTQKRLAYLHVIKGEAMVDDKYVGTGDAIALDSYHSINIKALSEIEALWFDLPPAS